MLPERAPLRQFVLTLPFELRARLAYDGKLLGVVCHAFVDSVLSWYRRHFAARGLGEGKSGAVTVVQRVSSDLRRNPHFHTIALDGVLAAANKWRARVVPPAPKPKPSAEPDDKHEGSTCTAKDKPPTHRSGYRPWRELLMRSFKIDVEYCASCGGRMKLRALVMTTASIERYLRWLGEPLDPPTLSPARDPPYFKSRVIRRRLGEPAQAELFDAH